MDSWVCQKNIERLRGLITGAHDDTQRALLDRLLKEEEEKLVQLAARDAEHNAPHADRLLATKRRD